MKKSSKFWLAIALILCLISSVGSSIVQTGNGYVDVIEMDLVMPSGNTMSANLYVPDTATAENPAPAIVTSHGWHNNKEMQDANFVEYSRRGYVVIAPDLYCHGDSTKLPGINHQKGDYWLDENNADGLYDAVLYLSTLPFVDKDRIAVTGHSKGGEFSTIACTLDNQRDTPLISSVLLICADPENTTDVSAITGIYGTRDVGIVAVQYDEFYHRVTQDDGSKSAPKDYINTIMAQTFLNFDEEPIEHRNSYTVYSKEVDGEDVMRVIYNPSMIHPWATMSTAVVGSSIEFFEQSLGAPNPIEASEQIWPIKAVFGALGLVGMIMFLVNLILVLLDGKTFGFLKATDEVLPSPAPTGKQKKWFWITTIAIMVFSIWFFFVPWFFVVNHMSTFFRQLNPFFIGLWSAVCGIFTLVVLYVSYKAYGKANGVNLRANGALPGWKKALTGMALGLFAAIATNMLVFVSNWLFGTDYRLWVLTFRAFDADNLGMIVRFLPFYLIYYIANSISINCFSYYENSNKTKSNTVMMAIFNGLPSALMFVFMYGYFYATGYQVFESLGLSSKLGPVAGIWLIAIIVILPLAAVVSRIVYKKTRNPYIAGTATAVMVTIMACTNTLTLGI